jgi:hypothetical protein
MRRRQDNADLQGMLVNLLDCAPNGWNRRFGHSQSCLQRSANFVASAYHGVAGINSAKARTTMPGFVPPIVRHHWEDFFGRYMANACSFRRNPVRFIRKTNEL